LEKFSFSCIRAIRSLLAPGMLVLLAKSIVFTLIALFWFLLCSSLFFSWLSHTLQGQAIANFLPWLGSIGGTMIAWILFPALMPIIIRFFDTQIALLIEEEDYPDTARPAEAPFWKELLHDLRFSATAILLNILVLPLYMLPVINLILFYLLNGYLLGREFFVIAARRHIPVYEAQELFHRYGTTIILSGIALVMLATIPVINVLAPFWGIAFMIHLYHRLDQRFTVEFVPID
jgi:CysZ protein